MGDRHRCVAGDDRPVVGTRSVPPGWAIMGLPREAPGDPGRRGRLMAVKAKVFVTPKTSVLDPQGKAVSGALHSLGYTEVEDVRIGKYMEVSLSGSDPSAVKTRLDEMCRRLLANGTIEDYRFEIGAADEEGAGR